LRLAAHPDPQRQLTAQVMQRFLKITMNFRETIKNQIGYKPFIDGLRAVAILAVVAYHIGFKQTPGGFVGVDVFFVISGYLICTQMIGSLSSGNFSFGEFWARRALRILPSYLMVIGVSLIIAPFILVTERDCRNIPRSSLFIRHAGQSLFPWSARLLRRHAR